MHIHAFYVLTAGECSQITSDYKLLLIYHASWWLQSSICEMNLQLAEIFQWNAFSMKKKEKRKKSPLPFNQDGND